MRPKVPPGKSPKRPPRISIPRVRLVNGAEATSRVQQRVTYSTGSHDKLSIGGKLRGKIRGTSHRVVRNLLTSPALSLNTKVVSPEDLPFAKIYYLRMHFLLLYSFSYSLSLSQSLRVYSVFQVKIELYRVSRT